MSLDDLMEHLARHGEQQPPLTRRERVALVVFAVVLVGCAVAVALSPNPFGAF